MLLFGVTIPATVPQRSEILEGLMNYSVYLKLDIHLNNIKQRIRYKDQPSNAT